MVLLSAGSSVCGHFWRTHIHNILQVVDPDEIRSLSASLSNTSSISVMFEEHVWLSPRNQRDKQTNRGHCSVVIFRPHKFDPLMRSELAKRKDQLQEECAQMRRYLPVGWLCAGNLNPRIIGPPMSSVTPRWERAEWIKSCRTRFSGYEQHIDVVHQGTKRVWIHDAYSN